MSGIDNVLEKKLVLQVRPEREQLICSCYEVMGYRLEKVKRDEHADTELEFWLEDSVFIDPEIIRQCRSVLGKIEEIDRQVSYYFLKLDCLVGIIGVACFWLGFVAFRAGLHILFTILLILGIFGCTITLYLRPVFTRMGMKKYGREETALIAELHSLLNLKCGGDEA